MNFNFNLYGNDNQNDIKLVEQKRPKLADVLVQTRI